VKEGSYLVIEPVNSTKSLSPKHQNYAMGKKKGQGEKARDWKGSMDDRKKVYSQKGF